MYNHTTTTTCPKFLSQLKNTSLYGVEMLNLSKGFYHGHNVIITPET